MRLRAIWFAPAPGGAARVMVGKYARYTPWSRQAVTVCRDGAYLPAVPLLRANAEIGARLRADTDSRLSSAFAVDTRREPTDQNFAHLAPLGPMPTQTNPSSTLTETTVDKRTLIAGGRGVRLACGEGAGG